MGRTSKNIIGNKYGLLTVVSFHGYNPNYKRKEETYLCKCDCGNTTIANKKALLKGEKKSCGCIRGKNNYVNLTGKKFGKLTVIERLPNKNSMKDRCYNPKATSYKHYGGRGIKVCDEWKNSFKAFYDWAYSHGYDENAPRNKCTIDRINNDGDYEPSNCRWVDAKIQASNQRKRSTKK